jgi:hypothetical protein
MVFILFNKNVYSQKEDTNEEHKIIKVITTVDDNGQVTTTIDSTIMINIDEDIGKIIEDLEIETSGEYNNKEINKSQVVKIKDSCIKVCHHPEILEVENCDLHTVINIDGDSVKVFCKTIVIEDPDESGEKHKKVVVKLDTLENNEIEIFISGVDKISCKEKDKCHIIIKSLCDDDISMLKSEKEFDLKEENNTLGIKKFKFYPNPGDGKFNFSFSTEENDKLSTTIFDLNGRKIYEDLQKDFNGIYNENIDLSSKGEGIYFLIIEQNDKVFSKKIVIQ